jgi:hypothetical protein
MEQKFAKIVGVPGVDQIPITSNRSISAAARL